MDKDSILLSQHTKEKRESDDYKKRRYEQWGENYSLYRDKVSTNRLTQRQPINVPIMRETIQTWISKIDEAPELKFESRGNSPKHKTGEILANELWASYFDKLRLDIMDNLDKKIVGLQGRSFKIAGFSKGEFFIDLIDPYDIEVSPRVNPLDLDSAQYVIRTHIFKPLRDILANPKYTEEGKAILKMYLGTKEGLIRAKDAYESYTDKMDRLKNLGAENFDEYNATELLVELNESYKMVWNVDEKKFVRHLIVIAADKAILYNKPLKEAIGINRLPIVTWADDPDMADFWCDGKGDSVRTINKLVNMYLSQDVENRTYRNFGMNFYNTLNGTFVPRGYDPKPFGFYGVPGNPGEMIQQVRIEPLNDTSQQIDFLKNMIQSSVAQTATERGEQTKSRTTLGEIELNLDQSGKRNTVTAKNYRRAWEEIGEIFYALMAANSNGMFTIHKKGSDGKTYTKDIFSSDWLFPAGYDVKVVIRSERDALDQFALQKSQYAIANFQDNPVAVMIAKRHQMELMGWTTEQIEKAMAYYESSMGQGQPQEGEEAELPKGQASGKPFSNQQILQQTTA